jgi:1-deoxy-D-xylulose-5-phosphate reductoisomerase
VSGLKAAFAAARKGVRVALANKETLVAAGDLFMNEADKCGAEIIPVDSEHSAIFQCLNGNRGRELKKIILTASGGAFRNLSNEELKAAKASDALKHPVWNMGAKVTIDSATLMNKGLEIIEAMHLFNVNREQIEVVIHPESVIHSMVEFTDNAIIAELSRPDMRLPVQYAFTYPNRWESLIDELDFIALKSMTFYPPDTDKFPCLDIAYKCADKGGTAPLIMNSANEAAVKLYLDGKISFYGIPDIINKALDKFSGAAAADIDSIISIDREVKEYILNNN